jgi:hypothetical protein
VRRAVGDSGRAAGSPRFRWVLGAVRLAVNGVLAIVALCLLVVSMATGGLVVAPIALVVIGGLLRAAVQISRHLNRENRPVLPALIVVFAAPDRERLGAVVIAEDLTLLGLFSVAAFGRPELVSGWIRGYASVMVVLVGIHLVAVILSGRASAKDVR